MHLMFDDPYSHELAAQLPWSYVDVHEALRILAEAGADPIAAEHLLRRAAEEGIAWATSAAYGYAARAPWGASARADMYAHAFGMPTELLTGRPERTLEDELTAEIERRRRQAYDRDDDGA